MQTNQNTQECPYYLVWFELEKCKDSQICFNCRNRNYLKHNIGLPISITSDKTQARLHSDGDYAANTFREYLKDIRPGNCKIMSHELKQWGVDERYI